MDGGIELDIDQDGEVQVIENHESDYYCLANMTCKYATRTETDKYITILCSYKNKIQNVFQFEHCPAKKWHKYEHRHSPEIESKKGCYVCGCERQWRLKGKNNKWICYKCHPPPYEKDQIKFRKFKND